MELPLLFLPKCFLSLAERCSVDDRSLLSHSVPRLSVIFSTGVKNIEDLSILSWFSNFFSPPNGRLGKGWVIIQALVTGFTFASNKHCDDYQLGPDSGTSQRKKKSEFFLNPVNYPPTVISSWDRKKHVWKSIDCSSSFLLGIHQHVQIPNVSLWNKGSVKQKRCFKVVITLCWTPVTPTGKQRSYQTFLQRVEALIYAPALRITNKFWEAAQTKNRVTIWCYS